jgi:hypothetical protein
MEDAASGKAVFQRSRDTGGNTDLSWHHGSGVEVRVHSERKKIDLTRTANDRHAERKKHDEVMVIMADDVPGIDLTKPCAGLGLTGMRERVEAIGGAFYIANQPAAFCSAHACRFRPDCPSRTSLANRPSWRNR